jgi:predicted  nucleic acid-binding Zn-ribbon protein
MSVPPTYSQSVQSSDAAALPGDAHQLELPPPSFTQTVSDDAHHRLMAVHNALLIETIELTSALEESRVAAVQADSVNEILATEANTENAAAEAARVDLAQLQTEHTAVQAEVVQLTGQVQVQFNRACVAEVRIGLKDETEVKVSTELRHYRNLHSSAQTEVTRLKSVIEEMKEAQADLMNHRDDLEHDLAATQANATVARAENVRLRSQVKDLQDQYDDEESDEEFDQVQRARDDLIIERDELKKRLAAAESKTVHTKKSIAGQYRAALKRVRSAEQDVERLRASTAELNQRACDAERRVKRVKRSLEETVEAMDDSE